VTQTNPANSTGRPQYDDAGVAVAPAKSDWLCLAAAPTFALMALLTSVLAGGSTELLCAAGHGAGLNGSALNGMVSMYLLMSAFHSAPWLKLIASRRSARRSRSGLGTAGARPL
jgi:hypothetical protein